MISPFPTGAEMAQARADAESGMLDTCTIRRENGTTRDPVTGLDVPAYDVIYTGKCKVQMSASTLSSTAQEVGGALLTQTSRYVHIPMSAPEVLVDDLVDVTASEDAHLVGKTFRVTSPFAKTWATARRLEVKEP